MRLLLLTLILLLPITSVAQVLTGKTVWSGSVEVTETIRVEQGAELFIAASAQISFFGGRLEIAGRLIADGASFNGKKWQGIVLKGCDASTTLRNLSISGARIGVQVIGGQPLLENNSFTANRVGVELRNKSAATIRNNRFAQNEKVGLFVKDGSTAVITGNRFIQHEQYAAYIYRATPKLFSGNIFEKNATGLMVSFAGSDPELKQNRFAANKTGIRVERAARPSLIGNTITGNEIGIDLYRRADPKICGNLIEHNGKGIAIAYSSYPLITRNNFRSNGRAIFLEYQSSLWEGQQGGVERSSETVRRSAFGGQNKAVTAAAPPRYLDGTIHAVENWWGEKGTAELIRIGKAGNPDFILDGRDLPTFIDAGKSYPLDLVTFVPWHNQPFAIAEGVE
jgi:parallel beta-helix repeat protein